MTPAVLSVGSSVDSSDLPVGSSVDSSDLPVGSSVNDGDLLVILDDISRVFSVGAVLSFSSDLPSEVIEPIVSSSVPEK